MQKEREVKKREKKTQVWIPLTETALRHPHGFKYSGWEKYKMWEGVDFIETEEVRAGSLKKKGGFLRRIRSFFYKNDFHSLLSISFFIFFYFYIIGWDRVLRIYILEEYLNENF